MRPIASMLLVAATAGVLACQRIPPRPLSPTRMAAAYDARSLDSPGLATFLETAQGRPLAEWPLREWDVQSLTFAALYFHPGLEVARAHAEVARAAIESAAARPNPTLAVSPQLSANPMGAVSPWLTMVNFDWPIETAGKRARRIERADATADAARAAVTIEAWRIRRQLASSLVALAAASRQRQSLADEVALEERLVGLLEARLRAGWASVNDVAPVRFALLQATTDRAAAQARRADAFATLAAALGVPVGALTGATLPDGLDRIDADALLGVSSDEARRRALLERADMHQTLAEYAAAEATLGLELARQYPDIRVGPSYEFDQGQNKWGLTLAIDVPILDRNQGPIAEAVAARAEAAAKFTATQAGIIADVEQALARRDGERTRHETLRAVAADRAANLARTTSGVDAGAVDRVTALGAELERLRALRAAADAEGALQQALVDLEAAIAGPLPAVVLAGEGT
jgi:outer membrane protein TolC